MAAPDFTEAATMEAWVIRMEAEHTGTTVRGAPMVREAATPTGMMAPEVQPDGAEARHPGIRALVTSADIAAARRVGVAAPVVRRDGAAAPRRGAADRVRSTAPLVALVRGDVEPGSASTRGKRILLLEHGPPWPCGQLAGRTVACPAAF